MEPEAVAMVAEESSEPMLSPSTAADIPATDVVREDGRCSPDPMRETDRYRLVTPYISSGKDL